MEPKQAKDYWCPMGRISIQQVESGRISVIQSGAYNLVLPASGPGMGKERFYFSSMCFGEKCPYYRRGFNPWGWGRCALAGIDYRPWIAAGIALALLGLLSLWLRS